MHLAGGGYQIALVATDPHSEELIEELPLGKDFRADIKEDRTKADLKIYWASLGLLVANYSGPQPALITILGHRRNPARMWPTSESVHLMLMEALGHTHKLWRVDGTYRIEVDSIALDAMGETDFKAYLANATHILTELFGYDPVAEWKAMHPGNKNWQRNWRPGDKD